MCISVNNQLAEPPAHVYRVRVSVNDALRTRRDFVVKNPRPESFTGIHIVTKLLEVGRKLKEEGMSHETNKQIKYWASMLWIWRVFQRRGLMGRRFQIDPQIAVDLSDGVLDEMRFVYNTNIVFYSNY